MPETKTRPALTAEEWAKCVPGRVTIEYGDVRHRQEGIHEDGVVVSGVCDWDGYLCIVYNPHKTAALCLHGQPFGFTREMVEYLANPSPPGHWSMERVHRVREAIHDRIEALLPPEE